MCKTEHFFRETALQVGKAFVIGSPTRRKDEFFPGSSVVEHSTVNRSVAGSNPARGANHVKGRLPSVSGAAAFFVANHPRFASETFDPFRSYRRNEINMGMVIFPLLTFQTEKRFHGT
ncbi:hypothetical protein RHIZ404_210503 [Rhizobium sp. EC-SD404]|nr:hypothetical protein RHIZ404_210503 [Rhizobium sp. EC-SD404]